MSTSAICWTAMLCFLFEVHYNDCKNVVFLPVAATSHARLHAFVAEELAKMGHKVWVGLPSALYKRKAETYPGVNTFRYKDIWEPSEETLVSKLEATFCEAVNTGKDPNWDWVWEYDEYVAEFYLESLKEGSLIQFIESLRPDLIVLDWFPTVDERVAIAYKLKVPFAILSALQDFVTARIPFNPVAEAYNNPYIRNNATLFETIQAVFSLMTPLFMHVFNDRGYMQQLFPNDPNAPVANEFISQAEIFIMESDPIFDYPRPTLPNLKHIGGVSTHPAKELQDPFKSFVERSEKAGIGVAVLSFGSLVLNLPKATETKIVSALRRIKLNTIWRANFTSPDPDKILTSTWLPTNDLLGHQNVKVFMSHCGMHSLYEAVYHAVPTVCLPLFTDQQPNADRSENKGFCITVDIVKASSDELVSAIEHVAASKEIKSKISAASEIYRQLYKNARQEGAFWLHHVLRYGGSYMRYSGQKMPMIMFLLHYIIVFLVGVVFTLCILLLIYVIKLIISVWLKRNIHLKNE